MQTINLRNWFFTLVASTLIVGVLLVSTDSNTSGEPVGLRYIGESAGRMVDRHLSFYDGYEKTSYFEQTLHHLLFGTRHEVESQSIAVFRDVLDYFDKHPQEATPWVLQNTQARLLVTLAETKRWEELEQAFKAFDNGPEEEAIIFATRFAYGLNIPWDVSMSEILYGARLLPLGWASDHLRMRIAEKLGNHRQYRQLEKIAQIHGQELRIRLLLMSCLIATIVISGFILLGWTKLFQRPTPWQPGILKQPWSATAGLSVTATGLALAFIVYAVINLLRESYLNPGILSSLSALFASLPLLWLVHRFLLRPRGLNFREAFGLSLRGVPIAQFASITMILLAIEWTGSMLIGWTGWKLGLHCHWSEGLHELSIFGPWQATALNAFNSTVLVAVIEEITFRGLVYVTLRSFLKPLPAIILSAAFFSVLHFYSLLGFFAVFWSGIVLAYTFERFRSLLPCIIIHSSGNMLSLATVLLFYR